MKKQMKSALSLFLMMVMIITLVQNCVLAAPNSITIEATEKTAIPGSIVDVDISLKNNPGVSSIGLNVAYNGDVLSLERIVYNSNLGGNTQSSNLTDNPATMLWVNSSENFTGNEVFATLTFRVSASAKNGDKSDIILSFDEDDIYNIEEQNVSCQTVNGKVTVNTVIAGDINNDTKVNNKDVSRLMQYLAHWKVEVNALALDCNGDEKVNNKDVSRLMQYLANWDVKLYPNSDLNPDCEHNLTKVEAVEPTCKKEGHAAYYACSLCGKKFNDFLGTTEVRDSDIIIPKRQHIVVIDPAVAPTSTTEGKTEGSHCAVCGEVINPQQIIPIIDDSNQYLINYNVSGNDSYLQSIVIENKNNPITYNSNEGVSEFEPLTVAGYRFEGWYNAPGTNGVEVKSIPKGTTGNKTLYARWTQEVYDVTYKLYQTPLKPISEEKYLHFTTGKGLVDLPNPTINNYIFLGWYTDDGEEVISIPAGKVGDITLNAYWTSKRNLAKAKGKLDDPIIYEDTDNGVVYFTYELGTIENIPLSENIWTIQSVSGLAQQKSETYTTSLTQTKADTISNTISNSTVDSGTWTLSEGWNETTSVTKEWAEQHGLTVEEANEKCTTSSNTFSITDSNGGSSSTSTTDGTTTVNYNSQNHTHGNSAEFGTKISAKYTNSTEVSASAKAGYGPVSAQVGAKNTSTFEIGGELSAGYKQHQETNEHTGTDTTKVHTTVGSTSSTWNSSSTASSTKTASERSTVSKAVSDIISQKTGYGSSYNKNGQNSETKGFSNSESESVNSSSALTWSSAETKTVTNTYSTDGKSEGCYRLVIAGKAHVFGLVGYDIASKSYFTNTFSIMDDNQYEFLDYAPDLNFNDCENGVLPFEIPYFVYEYSTAFIASTDGIVYRTDSTSKTATVIKYNGISSDVTIPNYITSGGIAYKVKEISADAFTGKNIRSIILSKYVEKIPAKAFKDCSSLEQISGYYNVIGDEAFSGCTSLENYNITISTKSIGKNAFYGVPRIVINAISSEYALEYADKDVKTARTITQTLISNALDAGANSVVLNLADIIDGCELTIDAGKITYFELQGGNDKYFKDLKLTSKAASTVLKRVNVTECNRTPLIISSNNLTLDTVNIKSNGYCLMTTENTNITLIRDNILNSINRKAIVCKNPIFESEVSDGVSGFLEISGNSYICGTLVGIDNIDIKSGEIVYISEEEFEKYIKGSYEVSFDANEGEVETDKTIVFYGEKYGELPVPTRDYYEFKGWFTKADGGTEVTKDTIFEGTNDLTLYAHWEINPTSNWVLASELPDGAKVESEKWTYDLTTQTTSNSSTAPEGYTSYKDPTWVWSSWGNWSGWSDTKVTASESREVGTQQVAASYKTVYNYFRYSYGSKTQVGSVSYSYQPGGASYYTYTSYSEMPYKTEAQTGGAAGYGYTVGNSWILVWKSNPYTTKEIASYKTQYRYRDRSKVYTYYYQKVEELESPTEIDESDSISNVQKWVKYINK